MNKQNTKCCPECKGPMEGVIYCACACHSITGEEDTKASYSDLFPGKPTPDSEPLELKKQPRNTILGASLVLEAMFPDLSVEEVNRLSPYLAEEFSQAKREERDSIRNRIGFLRQWLNEDRITDKKPVTNEDIEHWLHLPQRTEGVSRPFYNH